MLSSGNPIIFAIAPRAIILGRPPFIVFARLFMGRSSTRAGTSGSSPPLCPTPASLTTRLSLRSGISPINRLMLPGSMASTRSKLSSGDSVGPVARRITAAASPPLICGPAERLIKPYQPAFAATSSNRLPVVMTPEPPLPVSAMDKLWRYIKIPLNRIRNILPS